MRELATQTLPTQVQRCVLLLSAYTTAPTEAAPKAGGDM
jgi:hypothetical protein